MSDRRCRFGLAARIEMVRRRRAGESLRQIAVAMACSPTTVKTQIDRWNAASDGERADFSCLHPRRPVPRSCPHALSAQDEQRILQARARTNWGPMRLTILCGRPSLDDLEGPQAPRRQPPPARRAPDLQAV